MRKIPGPVVLLSSTSRIARIMLFMCYSAAWNLGALLLLWCWLWKQCASWFRRHSRGLSFVLSLSVLQRSPHVKFDRPGILRAVVMVSWIMMGKVLAYLRRRKVATRGKPCGEWGQGWSFQAVMCPCVMLTFFCCICCISGCVLSWKLLAHVIGMLLNVRRGCSNPLQLWFCSFLLYSILGLSHINGSCQVNLIIMSSHYLWIIALTLTAIGTNYGGILAIAVCLFTPSLVDLTEMEPFIYIWFSCQILVLTVLRMNQ